MKKIIYNLYHKSSSFKKKLKVDLVASSIVFKERHNIPVSIEEIEKQQPISLRKYFRERIIYFRNISKMFL